MAVSKINDVAIASVAKVNDAAKGSIAKIGDVTVSAASTRFRVAMVVGGAGEYYWSTSSNLSTVADWHKVDLGTSVHRDVSWGFDSAGNECWIMTTNQTARPIRVAVSDGSDQWVPSASTNWTDVRPQGGDQQFPTRGWRVRHAYHARGNTPASASWHFTGDSNSTYAYYVTGTINDQNNWDTMYRGFDAAGTNSAMVLSFNGSASAGEGAWIMAVNTTKGEMFLNNSGGFGKNDYDPPDWEEVFDAGGTGREKSNIAYGNNKWVVAANGSNKDHLVSDDTEGGRRGFEWSTLSNPGTNRTMNGVATDMSGNWIMVGDAGYIWTSGDNASSWAEAQQVAVDGGTSYKAIEDVAYDNNGTWLAAGAASFYVSTNNGSSWTAFDISTANNVTYNGVAFNVVNTSQ